MGTYAGGHDLDAALSEIRKVLNDTALKQLRALEAAILLRKGETAEAAAKWAPLKDSQKFLYLQSPDVDALNALLSETESPHR